MAFSGVYRKSGEGQTDWDVWEQRCDLSADGTFKTWNYRAGHDYIHETIESGKYQLNENTVHFSVDLTFKDKWDYTRNYKEKKTDGKVIRMYTADLSANRHELSGFGTLTENPGPFPGEESG